MGGFTTDNATIITVQKSYQPEIGLETGHRVIGSRYSSDSRRLREFLARNRVPYHCGPGSQSELIDGVGHFMMVQRPTDINKRILEFLAA